MQMEYERAVRFGKSSILALDNIHALCPSGSGQGPDGGSSNVADIVKIESILEVVRKWIEAQEIQIILVARHYSEIDQRLFEVGFVDSVEEIKAPGKEQRAQALKKIAELQSLKGLKDIDLQKLAQLTEYFLARDMDALSIYIGQMV